MTLKQLLVASSYLPLGLSSFSNWSITGRIFLKLYVVNFYWRVQTVAERIRTNFMTNEFLSKLWCLRHDNNKNWPKTAVSVVLDCLNKTIGQNTTPLACRLIKQKCKYCYSSLWCFETQSDFLELLIRAIYRVIQKDELNFVRLYFLNYTRYVNDLHNIWKRRS